MVCGLEHNKFFMYSSFFMLNSEDSSQIQASDSQMSEEWMESNSEAFDQLSQK